VAIAYDRYGHLMSGNEAEAAGKAAEAPEFMGNLAL
jgi:hypothetical protein